jgi:hypothetical protein
MAIVVTGYGDHAQDLGDREWDVAFVGEAVDERGLAAVAFVREHAKRLVRVASYDPAVFTIQVDDSTIDFEEFVQTAVVTGSERVVLEATTLGFVELFGLVRHLIGDVDARVDVLYVEPTEYAGRTEGRRSLLLTRREFDLSEKVSGYRGIPGAAVLLTDRTSYRGVFFLGFEERRLDVAFEAFQMIRADHCDVVFGVPAYEPGWEMDAFANNVRVIGERRIRGEVHFCAAQSASSAEDILGQVFAGLEARERLFVAPIGTKPHGIGAAVFAASHPGVGILYDHPTRRRWRSAGVRKWHCYRVLANGAAVKH